MRIDLNCDMGEGCGSDAELMPYISSTNIACGNHAGDIDTMKRTVDLALEHGVAIGAHPGYADRENFGRTSMNLPIAEVHKLVTDQIADLNEIVVSCGGRLSHVKPHGALYNQAAGDTRLATAIAGAVRDFDDSLIFYGLANSLSISTAMSLGLKTANEVFADRTYQTDGSLTPRGEPNALIADEATAVEQVLDMIKYGRIRSFGAIMIPIVADTVCIHGDGEHAVSFARAINSELRRNGVTIFAING